MRNICVVLLFAVVMLFTASSALAHGKEKHIKKSGQKQGHSEIERHYHDSLFQVTENGEFGIEVVIKYKDIRQHNNLLDIIVHDKKSKDVGGAVVTVTPWMPEMNHGIEKPVEVETRSPGLYRVEDLDFNTTGHWELRIHIKHGEVEDECVFEIEVAPGTARRERIPT